MGPKQVVWYFGRGASRYGKNQRGSVDHGIDPRVFVNKDSPDYKPNYGKTFTERQLKILNEEIPLDQVRLQEIAVIKNKAEALGDDEKVEIAKTLYAFKTGAEEYKFAVSVEDAKATLQSLTPWEIDWDKQK